MRTLVLLALGYAAFYVLMCGISPWAECRRRRCRDGRIYSFVFRRTFRNCPRCRGTGRRVRIGRRVWNLLVGSSWPR